MRPFSFKTGKPSLCARRRKASAIASYASGEVGPHILARKDAGSVPLALNPGARIEARYVPAAPILDLVDGV